MWRFMEVSGGLWHRERSYIRLWLHSQYLLEDEFTISFGLFMGLVVIKKNIDAFYPLIKRKELIKKATPCMTNGRNDDTLSI